MYVADGLYLIEGEFPVWLLTALVGAFLSGIVYYSTTNEHRPLYHFVRINSKIVFFSPTYTEKIQLNFQLNWLKVLINTFNQFSESKKSNFT